MAGGASQDNDGMITDINVTPLVDIMLVLLIIFMLTAKLIEKQGIEVKLPEASSGADMAPTTLAFTLTADGQLFVNGKLAQEAELQSTLPAQAAANPNIQAIIAADHQVSHGRVIRLLDMIRIAGIVQFAFNIDPTPAAPQGTTPQVP